MADNKQINPSTSNAQTDTEAGDEGQDIEKAKRALKIMFDRGLMDEETYQRRLSSLTEDSDSA